MPAPPGLSLLGLFSEELDRAWWHAVEPGFFEGEVASVTVVERLQLLSGDGSVTSRSTRVPVALNDGSLLCRFDTVILNTADPLRPASNTVQVVMVAELGV